MSIQDPQPERRFARRGWITFDRNVNVKDICWNLNNLRVSVGLNHCFWAGLLAIFYKSIGNTDTNTLFSMQCQ